MNIPNQITLSRIFLMPFFILLYSVPFNWGEWTIFNTSIPKAHMIGGVVFLIAAGTDWLDGYYARKYNLITKLGQFLDPLADKLLVLSALVILVQLELASAWIAIIILSREFAVTGLRIIAASEGVVLAASSLGKIKTITQLIAIIFLLFYNIPFNTFGFPFATFMLYVALFFTIWSGLDYFIKNFHLIKESH